MAWPIRKSIFTAVAIPALILGACEGGPSVSGDSDEDHSSYPERDINGIITWAEGGAMDNVSRL